VVFFLKKPSTWLRCNYGDPLLPIDAPPQVESYEEWPKRRDWALQPEAQYLAHPHHASTIKHCRFH
jgi:hypothetical protein